MIQNDKYDIREKKKLIKQPGPNNTTWNALHKHAWKKERSRDREETEKRTVNVQMSRTVLALQARQSHFTLTAISHFSFA